MAEVLLLIASAAFVLLGLAHTLSELVMGAREPPEAAAAALAAMKEARIAMPGRQVSLFMFMRGFSLMMGVLLMGYGTLNLLLPSDVALSLPVLGLNVAVATLSLALAIRYFFAFPIVGTLVSLTCFSSALVLTI